MTVPWISAISSAGRLYDNDFSDTRFGDGARAGGRHWLWNNTFFTYAHGVAMRAQLRNRIQAGQGTIELIFSMASSDNGRRGDAVLFGNHR